MEDTELRTPDFLDEAYRLAVKGAELYLEVVGPTSAPTLFYLHGGPGYNSHSFRELMGEELTGYRVIYADQRGAGRSPAEAGADLSPEALAGDVLAILDALEVPRTSLLAHGFGALIAAEAAARAPQRLERLILVNPWVDMPKLAQTLGREAARLSGQEAPQPLGDPEDPATLVRHAVSQVGGKGLFDALLFPKPASRLRLEHADAELFAELQESPLTETDIWSLRARFLDERPPQQHPTVILVGQRDRSCYPDQAEAVLSALPHALVSLLEAGHYPWLDDPETFTDLLHQAMALPSA